MFRSTTAAALPRRAVSAVVRTASITGAFIALQDAIHGLLKTGQLKETPVTDSVAAISVGLMNGVGLLDLDYEEDSQCDTDMNVVMTGGGKFVEIQGTAEGGLFTKKEMDGLMKIAQRGIKVLTRIQKKSLEEKG